MKKTDNLENRIIEAFVEELHEKPYKEISVSSIARRANINRTSFYLYFDDVTHLVKYLCHDFFLDIFLDYIEEDACIVHSDLLFNNIYKEYEFVREKKELIIGLWSIKENDFSPYLLMQEGIQKALYTKLVQSNKLKRENVEFFSRIVAASAMASFSYFINNDCKNIDYVVQMAYKSLKKGDITLIE